MDIYTLNRAKDIQDELKDLNYEKSIWEGATNFCSGIEVYSNNRKYVIRDSLIDFTELKNRTLAYINSKKKIEETGKRI